MLVQTWEGTRWGIFKKNCSSVLRNFIDKKEKFYAIASVIAYIFSFVSINVRNTEEQFFLNVPQRVPSQVRTNIFVLGLWEDLVRNTNDIIYIYRT